MSFIPSRIATYILLSGGTPAKESKGDLFEKPRVQPPKAPIISIDEEADFSTNSIASSASGSALYVIPAQLVSVVCSDRLGLKVGIPFVDQSTLRSVVLNVKLHPIEPVE